MSQQTHPLREERGKLWQWVNDFYDTRLHSHSFYERKPAASRHILASCVARQRRRVLATRFDKRCKCRWWITQCVRHCFAALFPLSLSHYPSLSLSLCFSFPLHHSPTLFALVLICDKSSLTCVQLGNLAARCEDPFALESVAALAQQHIRHCTTTTQRHTHIDTLTSNYFEACAAICQTSLELSLSERRVWQPRDRRTCMTYGRYSWLPPLPPLLPLTPPPN